MSTKSLKLYGHAMGPNPWKVVIILEELSIPYEQEFMDMADLKKPPFLEVSVNGRVPAIEDPNTGITLWESNAIIDYLLDTYDKEGKLHSTQSPKKYYEKQWEHFQASGQGPYFGQKAWFTHFHSEKNITSAIERYGNEIKRVLAVIDLQLERSGKEYLTGDEVSYVDLEFIPWNHLAATFLMGDGFPEQWKKDSPRSFAWHEKLMARPAVKKAMDARAAKLSG